VFAIGGQQLVYWSPSPGRLRCDWTRGDDQRGEGKNRESSWHGQTKRCPDRIRQRPALKRPTG